MDYDPFILPAVVFLLLFYIYFARRKFANKQLNTPIPPAYSSQLENLEERSNRVYLKIEETERECIAKLDNRITTLNLLLEEADKRIKDLESLEQSGPKIHLEEKEKASSLDLKNSESLSHNGLKEGDDTKIKIRKLADAGLNVKQISSHLHMLEGEVQLILSLIKKQKE